MAHRGLAISFPPSPLWALLQLPREVAQHLQLMVFLQSNAQVPKRDLQSLCGSAPALAAVGKRRAGSLYRFPTWRN